MQITTSIRVTAERVDADTIRLSWPGGDHVVELAIGSTFSFDLTGEIELSVEDMLRRGGVHVPSQQRKH